MTDYDKQTVRKRIKTLQREAYRDGVDNSKVIKNLKTWLIGKPKVPLLKVPTKAEFLAARGSVKQEPAKRIELKTKADADTFLRSIRKESDLNVEIEASIEIREYMRKKFRQMRE